MKRPHKRSSKMGKGSKRNLKPKRKQSTKYPVGGTVF